MVSRRAGQAVSELERGPGVHQILPEARILPDLSEADAPPAGTGLIAGAGGYEFGVLVCEWIGIVTRVTVSPNPPLNLGYSLARGVEPATSLAAWHEQGRLHESLEIP